MQSKKSGGKKLRGIYTLGFKEKLMLFLEGRRSNPYRINTYNGTRFTRGE